MTDTRDQLAAHLELFGELGVDGLRREPEWRARVDEAAADRRPAAATTTTATAAPTAVSTAAAVAAPAPPPEAAQGQDAVQSPATGVAEAAAAVPAAVFSSPEDALRALREEIGENCTRCKLHGLGRSQVVFGVGNPSADLMFVGEAPGADEDIQGEPFVGRAGQLLTKIIEAIGLSRDDVYIANVIKCRPPGNRNPEPDEVAQCEPFLFRQVDIVRPKVIVALGKFAAQCLLKTDTPITRIRGREFSYRGSILIPTFHPAYLLRNPSAKREVWEDMKRVRAILSGAND